MLLDEANNNLLKLIEYDTLYKSILKNKNSALNFNKASQHKTIYPLNYI